MTLLETIRVIEGLARRQPSVKQIVQNDIFRLNAIPDAKYGVFAWTQGQHSIGTDLQTFTFTFFYVDRLTADKGNEIEVQSVGIQTLGNIIRGLEDMGIYVSGDWTAQTFNQRFLDECAGVFASVRLEVPIGFICNDDFIIPEPQPDPTDGPLHFIIRTDGGFTWQRGNTVQDPITIQYRRNDGEWIDLPPMAADEFIPVSAGDIVYFRGNHFTGYAGGQSRAYHYFGTTCEFDVAGHLNSLVLGDNYEDEVAAQSYGWRGLFQRASGLRSAEYLVLPKTIGNYFFDALFLNSGLTKAPALSVTTLAKGCCFGMFEGCNALAEAPELPATDLAEGCYSSMFRYCENLVSAPALPATTLAATCYNAMFMGCKALAEAPVLPAKALTQNCYAFMFNGCTKVNEITCLAESKESDSTYYWLFGVASNGVFRRPSNGVSLERGGNGIPTNWEIEII